MTDKNLLKDLYKTRKEITALKKKEDLLKKSIMDLLGDGDSVSIHGFKAVLTEQQRLGAIDLDLLKADDIDIDMYRKPSTNIKTIKVDFDHESIG